MVQIMLRRSQDFDALIYSTSSDFESIRAALMEHSAVVIRGAAEQELLAELERRAVGVYRAGDVRARSMPPAEANVFKHGHMPAAELGNEKIEALANSEYLTAMLRGVCRWPNPIRSPVDVLLRRILPPLRWNRRVTPAIEYHQDEYFSITNSPAGTTPQLCFTLWVPLVACGLHAPGLSVVRGSGLPIVRYERPPGGWKRYIRENYGRRSIWSPHLEVGDVLLFTSRAIHGSFVRWYMTKPRYSLEIRGGIN